MAPRAHMKPRQARRHSPLGRGEVEEDKQPDAAKNRNACQWQLGWGRDIHIQTLLPVRQPRNTYAHTRPRRAAHSHSPCGRACASTPRPESHLVKQEQHETVSTASGGVGKVMECCITHRRIRLEHFVDLLHLRIPATNDFVRQPSQPQQGKTA